MRYFRVKAAEIHDCLKKFVDSIRSSNFIHKESS